MGEEIWFWTWGGEQGNWEQWAPWKIECVSEESYKGHLGQEEDTMNLSGPGGDSGGKKDTKGNWEAFYFKILPVSKETRERKLDFLFCNSHKSD